MLFRYFFKPEKSIAKKCQMTFELLVTLNNRNSTPLLIVAVLINSTSQDVEQISTVFLVQKVMYKKNQKTFKNAYCFSVENNFLIINLSSYTSMMRKHSFSGKKSSYRLEPYKAKNSEFIKGMLRSIFYIDINI